MRQRIIQTKIVRDVWFLSLPLEEQRFFLQLLITDRVEMSGIFEYPDRDILHDLPFLNPQRLELIKKRFEADKKVYFCDGWVYLPNYQKHNRFTADTQVIAISKQLYDLSRSNKNIIDNFIKKGFRMTDFQDYLALKQRCKIKKQIKKAKPYLFGQKLDIEVDRVMGIANSGKLDWLEIMENTKKPSAYQTPESVHPQLDDIAKELSIRPWILFWFFNKKVLKLIAGGRTKSDYLALLKDIATSIKPLTNTQQIQAFALYSKVIKNCPLTTQQAETIMESKGLI